MMRQIAWVAAVVLALTACSGSDAPETPGSTPGELRIDGPAVVDPSYDPSQVDPSPPATEPAG